MSGDEETRKRERWRRIGTVLDAIFDAPPEQRERILAEQCAGDASLRAEVEAMLAAESRPDRRLDSPVGVWAGGLLPEEDEPAPAHVAGDRIGPYRLVRELGRGGMGTVWLAERADGQFEQQVALKLLKRGLDSDAILARFLDERRILARLRHPHIAQLLDGGITDEGRPYYVMEYVDGALITKWCDQQRLGVRKRLALFMDMVEAVQYAHQQLIIHRDLKPGNVMVSSRGVVKLLDFGIAKVLDSGRDSAEAATLTRLGWRMLTPEYAAPEQLRGDPATTGTDVYAMGVLLHELLAGSRPEPATERAADTGKPPPRPSTRVTGDAATTRGGSVERLRRTLRGDLDTIVLKALQPEPERRYGSAQALADDLRRYLNGAPVRARPDSAWYRARRFLSRHRWGTAAAALIVLSLAGGVLATSWQAREAARQAQRAERQALEAGKQARRAEKVKEFLVKIISQGDPYAWRGKEPTVREVLDAGAAHVDAELAADPELRAELLAVLGDLYEDLGEFDRAEALLKRSLDERRRLFGEDHEAYADSLYKMSSLLYAKGDVKGSEQAVTRAAEIFRRRLGEHPKTALALRGMAHALEMGRDEEQAIRLHRQALAIYRRTQGDASEDIAATQVDLGLVLMARDRFEEAGKLLQDSLAIQKRLNGTGSARYAKALGAYAIALERQGRIEQAALANDEAVGIHRKLKIAGELAIALNNRALNLIALGRHAEAERDLREALELERRSGSGARREGHRMIQLGMCLTDMGRYAEAEPLLRQAVAIMEKHAGPKHVWLPYSLHHLSRLLWEQGRVEEALPLARRADAYLQRQSGPEATPVAANRSLLARILFSAGEREQGMVMARNALRTLRRTQGSDNTMTASAAMGLANLELWAGRHRQSEVRLREVAKIYDALGSKPKAIEARMLRGVALTGLGELDQAEALLRDALEQRRAMYGEGNAKTAEARLYLGANLARRGRVEEGRALIAQGRAQLSGSRNLAVRFADQALLHLP